MRVTITGKVRQRTRINLLFFTVAGPWREFPFGYSMPFDWHRRTVTVYDRGGVNVRLVVETPAGGDATVRVSVNDVLSIPVAMIEPGHEDFYCEPIKGVIASGTVILEN